MVTRAHLALALALCALACTPILTDGRYSCADGGACPPGWQCVADRCRAMPGAALRTPCESSAECESGACTIDVPGSRAGYCTIACEEDADCNELGDVRCVASRCLVDCESRSDCPAGSDCQLPHEPMTDPPVAGSCAAVSGSAYDGSDGCMNNMECQPPAFCLGDSSLATLGVCSMWCTVDDNCPDGACVTLFDPPDVEPIRHCLRSCFGPMGGSVCTGGLICGRLGAGGPMGEVCIPPEWEGRSLPLPGPPSM